MRRFTHEEAKAALDLMGAEAWCYHHNSHVFSFWVPQFGNEEYTGVQWFDADTMDELTMEQADARHDPNVGFKS